MVAARAGTTDDFYQGTEENEICQHVNSKDGFWTVKMGKTICKDGIKIDRPGRPMNPDFTIQPEMFGNRSTIGMATIKTPRKQARRAPPAARAEPTAAEVPLPIQGPAVPSLLRQPAIIESAFVW